MSKAKIVIILTILIDVLGIGIVIPVLPFYVKSFGAGPVAITMLTAIFSLFAFLSAPFLGSLSDKIGRKPVLIASIVSTALGWFVFAGARNLLMLFIGRIIDGAAAGNYPIAQSYLMDISKDKKEQAENIGLTGAIFGIGFIIGPAIGGVLGGLSHTLPFWVAGVMATINALLAYFILPESNTDLEKEKHLSLNPFLPIKNALSNKILLPAFLSWFLFGIAVSMQQSIFSLYLGDVYGYGAFVAGLFMTGIGIVLFINQAFLIKRFWLKRFKELDLEILMMAVLIVGFILMSFNNFSIFVFGLFLLVASQSVLRVVMNSKIIGGAGNKKGEVLGIMSAITSLSIIIGPFIAGFVYTIQSYLPFVASSILGLIALVVIWSDRKKLIKMQMDQNAPPEFGI